VVDKKAITRDARGRALRVYTLDDGTKWTVKQASNKLNAKWKRKDTSIPMMRGRLNKSSNPEVIFGKPHITKPRTVLTKTEEDTAREMMNLALKNI
jgi:hypothetical protein